MMHVATTFTNCSVGPSQFVCNMGYYHPDDKEPSASSSSTGCQACAKPEEVANAPPCPMGHYRERCQPAQGPFACLPCTDPPLPNTTSYAYGYQQAIPVCNPGARYPADQSCALFLTPSWERYACALYCNVGYTNVNPDASAPLPDCRPCIEVCGLGFACSAISDTFRDCTPCAELNPDHSLPENARWLPECTWQCVEGYYFSHYKNRCVACVPNQVCFSDNQRFMGCHGESAGQCTTVNLTACDGRNTYLHSEIHSIEATCAPCTKPLLNATYQVAPCTPTQDSQLRPCSTRCADGFYIASECRLFSDIVCAPCTMGTLGQHMVEACGERSDARFEPCPSDGACDGTFTILPCPPPKIPHNGLCTCPPAMLEVNTTTTTSGSGCVPIPCASGWYPNATSGTCSFCGDDAAHTLPLRMGLEACACPQGFFIERAHTQIIRCWPCGDLQCTPGLQRQSACPGDDTAEPQCLCQIPPGAQLVDSETCAFECAPNYEPAVSAATAAAAAAVTSKRTPGWWAPSTFDAPGPSSLIIQPRPPAMDDLVVVAPDLAVLATRLDDTALGLVYQGHVHALNASFMLIQGTRERLVSPVSLQLWASHLVRDRFWIGFSFLTTLCAGVESPQLVECSTVEWVQISREGSCASTHPYCTWVDAHDCTALPLCVSLLSTGVWGKTMQAGFNTGLIWDLTGSAAAAVDTLYLLLNNGCVYAYTVQYYAPNTPQSTRADDPLQSLSLCQPKLNNAPVLAVVGSTLYLPGHSQGPAQALYTPPSDTQRLLSVEEGGAHWLVITTPTTSRKQQQQQVVDVWNGVAWPLLLLDTVVVLEAYAWGLSAWSNASHLWLMPQTQAPCPLDTLRYPQTSGCEPMHCIRLRDTCGPNSVRLLGTTTCLCSPGYYRASMLACTRCPANAYCPGNTGAPLPCGANAITQGEGASSVAECLCKDGYYPFQPTMCLPCPLGFWCLGARTLPIPCIHGGTTELPGAKTPLECVCPPRTYGLTCTPCSDAELCIAMDAPPELQAVRLLGWGPATLRISPCATNLPVYAITASSSSSGEAANDNNTSMLTMATAWAWLLVMRSETSLQEGLVACLRTQGFKLQGLTTIASLTQPRGLRTNVQCDPNSEWPGTAEEDTPKPCTCIAGYTRKRSLRTGTSLCVPCLNGTIRARRSPIETCVPCPGNHSHAPWLAMSHCVCQEGFYWDLDLEDCAPIPQAAFLMVPPAAMVSLSVLSGLLCLLGFVLAPRLIP